MHIHMGVHAMFGVFLGVLLFGTIWRLIAMKLADTSIGQAMALMY